MSDSFIIKPDQRKPAEPVSRKVFVTGAAGNIGSYFSANSADRYELTLMVQRDSQAEMVEPYGQVVTGDLTDLEALKQHMAGMDTVVHLAAQPSPETLWEDVLRDNIIGTYNAMVAAAAVDCRRLIYASSIHAVSGYDLDRQIQTDDPVNPGDLYGVSKCYGEAMGRFMATQHGLEVMCIRIGAFHPLESAAGDDASLVNLFVSRRDLTQLIQRCIDDTTLLFGIFHGLSNNPFNRMNIADGRELLGYEPEDDFAAEHPQLKDVKLSDRIDPHSESGGQQSGIRKDL
ncbi:MAG: NAD-dependent epimerase/dehydratase family protein [Phycisphaerae bacterium]